MISMIWAMDESNLIGKDNKMPWHIKEDLIYYKNTTKNHNVLMGYNNYLSMCEYYKERPFPYFHTYDEYQAPPPEYPEPFSLGSRMPWDPEKSFASVFSEPCLSPYSAFR